MKNLVFLITGLAIGIAGTIVTNGSAFRNQTLQPEPPVSNDPPIPQTAPEVQSPFTSVSSGTEPNTANTSSTETTNTASLTLADGTALEHYLELQASLLHLQNADSDTIMSLLNDTSIDFHSNAYSNALYTALYQRWAETDIDAALLQVVEQMESRGGRYAGNPMEAVSILAATDPEYVSEWIENHASDVPSLMHAAYSGIASKDPEAFIRNYLANSDGDNPFQDDEFGALHSAFMHWADQDPQAAMAFLENEAQPGDLHGMKEGILYTWYDRDPDAAIRKIEALLNDPASPSESHMMLTELYTRHLANTNPDEALQWALAQDDPMDRENALMSLIYSWDENNPHSLLSLIDQLPAAERESILPMAAHQIANTMARNDPTGAIAWAESLPIGSREGAIMSVVEQWIYTDPDSAINWIQSQPATPENRQLLMTATGSMLYTNPTRASEIFTTLPEDMQSDMAEQMVYMQVDENPDTARDWVAQQTNPVVQEIGYIALDSMNPEVDAISILDRIGSLQSNNRGQLFIRAIDARASTDLTAVKQWVTDTPLLTDMERDILTEMTSSFASRFGMPPESSAGYYLRRK